MSEPTTNALSLPTYGAAATPIAAAERTVAALFAAAPPTRQERQLAKEARTQLVQIALAGGKTKLGQRELVSLVEHTDRVFWQGTAAMYGRQQLPAVSAQHANVTGQFTDICVLALNRYLQGAMENGAATIGELIAKPIEVEQKSLLATLLGR